MEIKWTVHGMVTGWTFVLSFKLLFNRSLKIRQWDGVSFMMQYDINVGTLEQHSEPTRSLYTEIIRWIRIYLSKSTKNSLST